jgi:hypothetical protein
MKDAEDGPDREASAEKQDDGEDAQSDCEDLGGDAAGDDTEDRRRHTLFHTQRPESAGWHRLRTTQPGSNGHKVEAG